MAEYIKRETAVKAANEWVSEACMAPVMRVSRLLDKLQKVPAADVAPVVRCEDCVHWDDDPDTYGADDGPKGKCMKSFETMCADDFCSHGERREGTDG
jgi:hypothetical protein|nr:MAG TPA: hypothetical protein [Caudoviricetes sp.]